MRVRSLLVACALGSVTGLVALTLPMVISVPTASAPPEPTLQRARLTDPGETVHAGWRGRAEGKANLVSVSWKGDPAARFTVERRFGGSWHATGQLEHSEPGVDPNTVEGRRAAAETSGNISEPLWVGQADAVRVRLADGTASDVSLQRIESPKASAPDGVASASSAPVPRVISRVEWGADENLRLQQCPEGASYDQNVQLAVIHHTAGNNNYSPSASASIVRGLYAYAVQTLKYCDTHYNFFIDKYGQIFEGRFGGIDKPVHAAHTTGANTNTVGIAFIGDYSTTPAPPAAIESLKALLAWKFAWHGVDPTRNVWYRTISGTDRWPAGSVHYLNSIIGHRDPGITSCPGQALYDQLQGVRNEVIRRVVLGPVDQSLGYTPEAGKPQLMVGSSYGAIYPAGGQQPYIDPAAFPGRPIVKDIELRPGGIGGYALDGFGGLHPFGNAPPQVGPAFPIDIARDLVLRKEGGGWVLDGYGGIHPFGGAPPICCGGYWPGWDIARKLSRFSTGWYVMDAFGATHGVAGAPALAGGPWWPGWDIARDLRRNPVGRGGYVLDGFGGVWPVGGARKLGPTPWYGEDLARGLVVRRTGGYSLKSSGILTPFGGAPAVRQARSTYIGADAITTPYVATSVSLAP